ncbi:phage tail sheath family protein [Methanosarcina sp. WWM596]|uniref:phage tail sheath family protein n=1 Tax=Methanosarcina sp. WWM596 TaxID=1434103 RepID=UPI0006156F8B|nr:phage tail sheath family protein [Methanosarcina sp. WWM596]AKB18662.1 Phage tail sheath protein FI [Methanosarcina sp. WWM596]
MPEYLTPGVYLEEFEMGARPIEGVSTSTAGFLGETERGPSIPPKLVTSLTQFMRIYGGYIENSYLAYAVNGFFSNGGQRCYIGRIVHSGASPASLTLDKMTFKAVGEGSWGKRVGVLIENASSDPQNLKPDGEKVFKLTVAYWRSENLPKDFSKPDNDGERKKKLIQIMEKVDLIEVFDELSEDKNSQDHYLKKLSDPLKNISNLILIDKDSSGRPANTEGSFFELLTENGENGEEQLSCDDISGDPNAKPGKRRGLTAFTEIDDISIVYVPDIHLLDEEGRNALRDNILTHCETMKDRFAILDIYENETDIGSLMIERPSKYGALYYPWIKIYDPLTKKQTSKPPGGYIAGIYARSDTERGVHKAPANELVRGAMDLEFQITKQEQGILNPRGINVIRSFPGRGILVWGARTCIVDALWKYINVRRLFIFIEKSIERGTQWAVFEPNNEKLWARVKATITQFLTTVWKDGALMGTKPEEAFFVKCDRSTMTQDDIDNGRLICIIGIAPVKPAEFVIFRIAQWAGGSAATE